MLKLYEVTIIPRSSFGTPIMGDTMFGHICWQCAYDEGLLTQDFSSVVKQYGTSPFLVVSSAFPVVQTDSDIGYAMPRPELALLTGKLDDGSSSRKIRLERAKELKKKKWMVLGSDLVIDIEKISLLSDAELTDVIVSGDSEQPQGNVRREDVSSFVMESEQMHNSINRLTQTTGEGFSPYVQDMQFYLPGIHLVLFIIVDNDICPEQSLREAIKRIGSFGYGRDASSGLGRFELGDLVERDLPSHEQANACYTLAPCVPVKEELQGAWFQPFTRFGKHGGGAELGGKPFKNPVVMAAEGAVFSADGNGMFKRPYIGRAVTDVSKTISATVVQGYSPYLPCNVEV